MTRCKKFDLIRPRWIGDEKDKWVITYTVEIKHSLFVEIWRGGQMLTRLLGLSEVLDDSLL
jgi:hypothetical protein